MNLQESKSNYCSPTLGFLVLIHYLSALGLIEFALVQLHDMFYSSKY